MVTEKGVNVIGTHRLKAKDETVHKYHPPRNKHGITNQTNFKTSMVKDKPQDWANFYNDIAQAI